MENPKLNEVWQVQWGMEEKKKYNILVKIDEDKTELNPLNWRKNAFKCEHKGEELIVSGECFIEKWSD